MKFSGIFGLRPSAKYISASVAALGALAITAQANAADIYAPVPGGYKDIPVIAPMPVWTGFYAGVNMGAAWSELNVNRFYEPGYTTCVAPGVSGGGYCFGGDRLNSTNAFGGGQFGYNWQGWGNFVVGLEVDLEGIAGGNERSFFGVTHPGSAAGTRSALPSRRMAVSLAMSLAALATHGATGCSMQRAVSPGSILTFQPGLRCIDGNWSAHRHHSGLRTITRL